MKQSDIIKEKMYELIKINENDYYIECPSRIGIVRIRDGEAILIDAGSDKGAAKKVKKALDGLGLRLVAIYSTHAHADHTGGNAYLQRETGCRIFARGIECAMIRHPILLPITLYGADPTEELCGKFLLAEPSPAEYLDSSSLPEGFSLVELCGHTPEMYGVRTPSGTVYLADALSSEQTLDKYGIGFIYDIEKYLDTLMRVETMEASIFVPSHAPVTSDIAPLARLNADRVRAVADKIVEILNTPMRFEELLSHLCDDMQITMSVQQYALVGSTVRSYLSYLRRNGLVSVDAEGGALIWSSVQA